MLGRKHVGWRGTAALAFLSVLLLGTTQAAADQRADPVDRGGVRGITGFEDLAFPPKQRFLGRDGRLHETAGWTVRGRNGTVYLGEELDYACAYGEDLRPLMRSLADFARIIERSGRRVLFYVAPSKSAVNKADLPGTYPHGACDSDGIAAQDQVLDSFKDPNYLPTRTRLAGLARAGAQAYWDIDSHWTTVGATRIAQQLARRLDPRLAKRQRYGPGVRTHVPDVYYVGGRTDVTETARARLTKTRVQVRPAPGSVPYDVETLTGYDLAWSTTPARRTWRGRTLLLGDSFTYVGMESTQVLFEHGRFVWVGHVGIDTMTEAIVDADTVVIEVAQRYVPLSLLTQRPVQLAVAGALAADAVTGGQR